MEIAGVGSRHHNPLLLDQVIGDCRHLSSKISTMSIEIRVFDPSTTAAPAQPDPSRTALACGPNFFYRLKSTT